MMLIYSDESQDTPYGTPEWDQLMKEYRAFGEEARRRNAMIAGDPLQSVETATTLRLEDGKTITLDGPFAETREQLGGYYILECKDKAEALELAAMIPAAKRGSIEVRTMAGHDLRVFDPPHPARYIVLIYGDETRFLAMDDPRLIDGMKQHRSLTEQTVESGEYVTGDALAMTKDAITVRVRGGEVLHFDGPFAETKEQLGGFYIFNVSHLDRALELARQLPLSDHGCLEIRPLQET